MTNAENENIVILSILNDNTLMEDISLEASDFTEKDNRDMFKNMQEQYVEDMNIELVEILESDLDSHYVEKYKEQINTQFVSDITRYVNRMKEASKKQAIEDSMKKYTSLGSDITSSEAVAELATLVSEFEKNSSNKNEFNLDIQNLSDVIVEQPDFYLKKFLPLQANEINLISAAGGVGKSYLGVLLLSKLQQEYELNIFAWFSEDTSGFVKDRANQLKAIYNNKIDINFDVAGKGHAMGFVDKGKNGNLQPSKFFEFFKKQMQKYDVILLDPLIQFMGSIDENSNGDVRYFFNLLNTWAEEEQKTFIIIHHHNKGSNDADGNKTTSVRGASAIIDAVRVHYSISAIDPRIKPIKNGKGKVIKVEQKMSDTYRYCKVEKANHFNGGDGVFTIQVFDPKKKTDRPIEMEQEKVLKELEVAVAINSSASADNYDEIPF